MTYVPKCTTDVFVSYAHEDDAAQQSSWVSALVLALEHEIRKRIGGRDQGRATVWMDTEQLRLGDAWAAKLEEAVRGAATFMAIVSPNYMTSPVCSDERNAFLRSFGEDAGTAFGRLVTSRRFLKAIRLPLDDKGHERFLPGVQHLNFFRSDRGEVDIEFSPSSDEFRHAVVQCATAIKGVLQTLKRQSERIFVAWAEKDCRTAWHEVQAQLRSEDYDVQPEGPIDVFVSDDQILERMRGARVSVHLLGSEFDEAAFRQLRLAVEARLTMILWRSPAAAATTDDRQQQLLERVADGALDERTPLPPGWTLLGSGSLQDLYEDVRVVLKRPLPAVGASSGSRLVYLLCDPTTDEDATFAHRLSAELVERERLTVTMPPASADERRRRHEESLRECDGVLVYCQSAPRDWLRYAVEDVTHAESTSQRRPLRSKALLMPDPTPWRGYPLRLIPRRAGFSLSDLEPFLAPLRGAPETGARG
jgi:hypothetical protein